MRTTWDYKMKPALPITPCIIWECFLCIDVVQQRSHTSDRKYSRIAVARVPWIIIMSLSG